MSFIVPIPPSPDPRNPLQYSRAVFAWMNDLKGKLERSQPLANGVAVAEPQKGMISYRAMNAWLGLAAGSAGQIMTQGTSTAPTWTGLSAAIDTAITGTQGDILYRGTSAWTPLAAGTSGDFLMTQGTGANPAWATRPRFKVGNFTRDLATATGTQAITGVGFKPKAIIIFGVVNGSAGVTGGFSEASSHGCFYDDNAVVADTWQINTAAILLHERSSGNFQTATVSSLDSDGFTLSWTKTGTPTGTATHVYLAIG